MLIKFLRNVRHGQLRSLTPFWLYLGRLFRFVLRYSNIPLQAEQHIGPYGPFKLNGYFAFSNFKAWGQGHNNGFEACIEACKSANCFIDIGAHIGLVTLPAASVMQGRGHVHAFEPAQTNLRFLNEHIASNSLKNISVSDNLVGDENNLVDFFEASYPNGQNSRVITSRVTAYKQVKRRQITLDSYVQRNEIVPDIIKIDVEGSETAVIKGARETLNLYKPIVFLSVHPKELAETPEGLNGLLRMIQEFGYRCYELDGSDVVHFRLAEYVLKFDG